MASLHNIIRSSFLAGTLLITSCSRESEEMKSYGFTHISPTKIKYRNGFVAEVTKYDNRGYISEITVLQRYETNGTILNFPSIKYTKNDEHFNEIKENILSTSKLLIEREKI